METCLPWAGVELQVHWVEEVADQTLALVLVGCLHLWAAQQLGDEAFSGKRTKNDCFMEHGFALCTQHSVADAAGNSQNQEKEFIS